MVKKITIENNSDLKIELIDERHKESFFANDGLQGIVKNVKQNYAPILQKAAQMREIPKDRKSEMRHVAYIPDLIYGEMLLKMKREGLKKIPKSWIKEWCNDPANKMFRTYPGRV